jgi:hypothetical protein
VWGPPGVGALGAGRAGVVVVVSAFGGDAVGPVFRPND